MNAPSSNYQRSHELLGRDSSRLLIVDVQQKLLPLISVRDRLIHNCRRLIQGAQLLGVPAFATEQYPQGLGPTTPELAELFESIPDKRRFSCAEALDWGNAADETVDRDQVVVAGIEAHVCVMQTALDLISQGFRVHIPADSVASRGKFDWHIALERLRDCGAVITTTESVLFEWCETSSAPEFEQISQLITEVPPQ